MPSRAQHHRHLTPHALALALASPGTDPRLLERLASCEICVRARHMVEWWAERSGHPSPAVWSEYATAPALLLPLLSEPPEDRLGLLQDEESLQHWGLAVLALEESRDWQRSRRQSRELAVLAMTAAAVLPEDYYGEQPVATLRSATLLHLADLQLRELDVAGARESLAAVHHLWPWTSRPAYLRCHLTRLDQVLRVLDDDSSRGQRMLGQLQTA